MLRLCVCVCVYSLSVCFDEKRTAITDEAQAPPAVLFHCAVKVWLPAIRHTKATSLGATKQDFQDFITFNDPTKNIKSNLYRTSSSSNWILMSHYRYVNYWTEVGAGTEELIQL